MIAPNPNQPPLVTPNTDARPWAAPTQIESHRRAMPQRCPASLNPRTGQPLALRGWPQTWYARPRLLTQLAGHCTVRAPDLRGAGGSSKLAPGYGATTLAKDIHRLVQHLRFSSIRLILNRRSHRLA